MEGAEILQDILFVSLFGGVIMLDVAAALYLLLRRGNAIAPEVTSTTECPSSLSAAI